MDETRNYGVPRARPITVAAVQLAVEDGDRPGNADRAIRLMETHGGADCYLLPELWTTGYAHAVWAEAADRESVRVLERVSAFCRERGVWVGGSMIERNDQGRLVNRFRMLDASGQCVAVYDKAHLFAPMLEDVHLAGGRARSCFDLSGWHASPTICFDLRFPSMYRNAAIAGADLFPVVSAWPSARSAVMRGLAWARAVENQAFVVLCNRAGAGADGTLFGGGSIVVAPDGTVLAEAGVDEAVITAQLDPSQLSIRESMPVLSVEVPEVDGPAPVELSASRR